MSKKENRQRVTLQIDSDDDRQQFSANRKSAGTDRRTPPGR